MDTICNKPFQDSGCNHCEAFFRCKILTGESTTQVIESAPEYIYGMRLRGFSIGCQPKEGFVERRDDETGKYYDLIVYNRELTKKECDAYDLDRITAK